MDIHNIKLSQSLTEAPISRQQEAVCNMLIRTKGRGPLGPNEDIYRRLCTAFLLAIVFWAINTAVIHDMSRHIGFSWVSCVMWG